MFLLGLFWSSGNKQGAASTLIIGLPLGVAGWIANEILHLMSLQYLYACSLMFILSCVVFIIAAYRSPAPDPETIRESQRHIGDLHAEPGSSRATHWDDYRYQSRSCIC